MKLSIIGTGYVGLVSGACFAEFGNQVVCIDKDEKKIANLKKGIIPIYEPGLEDVVQNNISASRLHFTTSLESINTAEIIFIAVGTPTDINGEADLTYLWDAISEVSEKLGPNYQVIVTKSTVPVGTGDKVEELIRKINPEAKFDVVSNPEFLREGSAIVDFMKPDRIVIGVNSEEAKKIMHQLYRVLYLIETPIVYTTRRTAELAKYAANAFLATKIAFINEIADVCEALDANVQDISKAMGMDKRIGKFFLKAGPGFGGSCFPKDTLALTKMANKAGAPTEIVKSVVNANNYRKIRMAYKIKKILSDLEGKRLGILGLTFKPNTDDMREAPSLTIIPILQNEGAIISAHDPAGMEEAKKLLNVEFCDDVYSVAEQANALIILTEWNEFRSLDFQHLAELMETPIIIDLRNIFDEEIIKEAGFDYYSIGK